MNVKQIIDNAVTLCGLGDNPDSVEKNKIYLRYLNLVYMDVFQYIIDVHPNLKTETQEFKIKDGESDRKLDLALPLIKKVYTEDSNILRKNSLDHIMNMDPLRKITGEPVYYYLYNDKLCVYPKWKADSKKIFMFFIQEPMLLELSSQEEDILCPSLYHQVIVDGLCTRISLDELGDRVSNKDSKVFYKNYEKGMMELYAYLVNKYGNTAYSTYSWI